MPVKSTKRGRSVVATHDKDLDPVAVEAAVNEYNKRVAEAAEGLPWHHPIKAVTWVPVDKVVANDWNPNAVAGHEMKLLHTSISEDGYTQPVVVIRDDDADRWVIVDGFHRYTVMRKFADISQTTGGYLPVVVLEKSLADRMAATVRHNRARGKHSIAGMGSLVFGMLMEGEDDASICNKIGLEPEELARLKHVTGYSKLYTEMGMQRPQLTQGQMKARAAYRKEHPDEAIPDYT